MKSIFDRKSVFAKSLSLWSAFSVVATTSVPAFAAGTAVLGGNSELQNLTRVTMDKNDPNAAVFSSSAASGVLDWTKFNIGNGQSMTFDGAETTFFNLVDGAAGKSQIDGIINGNGNVWVINPAGVAFGATAKVDVGGLFAAAAGNLENAADLRNGTVTMPSFSSFTGSVNVPEGARFAAAQLALLGKAVVASGDFSGVGNLTIGAAGEMLVDEVEGGKVTVNLAEFVEKSDAELELGSLLIEGDLRAVTDGKIDLNGDVTAGSAYFKAGGEIAAKGDITANVGKLQLLTQDGDITVDKGVNLAVHGDEATLQVQAGQNEMSRDEDFNIVFSTGNVKIDGDLQADGASGTISVFGGYNGLGDVQVNGSLKSSGDVRVFTENGTVSVAKGAEIKSTGDDAKIRVYTGISVGSRGGDVDIAGNVEATGENAQIDIESGYNYYTDGALDVSGSIVANGVGGTVALSSGNGYGINPGNTTVSGNVEAETVSIKAYDKGVLIGGSATIRAGTYASLVGKEGVEVEGSIDARDGIVSVSGNSGAVSVSGDVKAYLASFKATGAVDVQNANNEIGSLSAEGGSVVVLNGSQLSVSKATATDGNVTIGTLKGDINVGGEVKTSAKDGIVQLVSAMSDEQSGDVFIGSGGKILAEQEGGMVLISAGYGESSSGSVGVLGQIKAGGTAYIEAAKGEILSAGSIDVSEGPLIAIAGGGNLNLNVNDTGVVRSHGASLQAIGKVAANNPKNEIAGGVSAIGTTVAVGGDADIELEDVNAGEMILVDVGAHDITVSGDVVAPDVVGLYGGGVTVGKDGSVSATGYGSVVEIGVATAASVDGSLSADTVVVVSDGSVNVNGKVDGDYVSMQSTGDFTVGGQARINAAGYNAVDIGTDAPVNLSVEIRSTDGDVMLAKGSEIKASSPNGGVYIGALGDTSKIAVDGTASAGENAYVVAQGGGVDVVGAVSAGNMVQINASGLVTIDGSVNADQLASVESKASDVVLNGTVRSDSTAMVSAGGKATINGDVVGGYNAAVFSETSGIDVNGTVTATGSDGFALLQSNGDVVFSSHGTLSGTSSAVVIAKGNLIQTDANLPYKEGRVFARVLRPAVSAKEVELSVGGSIGNGPSNPFVVDGKIYAISFGDVSLAAGNGHSLEGGDASSVAAAIDSAQYAISSTRKMLDGTLTIEEAKERLNNPSDFDDNAIMYAAGDMYLYSAGALNANSYIGSGGNMTVSAAEFGDMSYLQAGGTLTINNVGKPHYPKIAYFESVNGVEPKINNQPNDVVIFVDGRLAGGNLNILNQFGADEAFMVDTPELKSTQGIFGNPPFLHSDLDVANPMEVCAIDYMMQEVPRLTLSSDFPPDVDQNVEASGLSQKDVYWFGQKGAE